MSTATETPDTDSLPDEPETADERKANALAVAAPLDAALLTRPFGQPQRYVPRLRTVEALTVPPLSLNPESITKLEGYDEHSVHVVEAVGALEALQSTAAAVIGAREKSKLDPTMNESAAVLAVGVYAEKLMTPATMKVDAALKVIDGRVQAAEAELRSGIASGSSHLSPMAAEVRAYCRSLPSFAERGKFIGSLIDSGDSESLAAVLRGKPFLSGLTQQQSDMFVEQFNRRRRPELPARIEMLKKVQGHLETAGGNFALTMEAAMGAPWKVVKRLRDAKAAAAFG